MFGESFTLIYIILSVNTFTLFFTNVKISNYYYKVMLEQSMNRLEHSIKLKDYIYRFILLLLSIHFIPNIQ